MWLLLEKVLSGENVASKLLPQFGLAPVFNWDLNVPDVDHFENV